MIHIITPFSRRENLEFYLNNLIQCKNIIWHPITCELKFRIGEKIEWIQPYNVDKIPEDIYPNIYKINEFIDNFNIIEGDYYCFLNDDDWIEDNFFEYFDTCVEDVIFCSMKRGYRIPKNAISKHGITDLIPHDDIKVGEIGLEQIIIRGGILKSLKFKNDGMFDGLMAEELQKTYNVKYVTNKYVYFNFLEKGRWGKMETIDERFERFKREPRDINEHLDTLYKYAKECESITELGVNEGCSSVAFLKAVKESNNKITFTNVDVHIEPTFKQLQEMAEIEKVSFNFILADDLTIQIPECDLLFIDTLHTGDHLRKELKLHANKVNKYIIFHDTVTFGEKGIDGLEGLMISIKEFLKNNDNWIIKEHFKNNNGLTILKKI